MFVEDIHKGHLQLSGHFSDIPNYLSQGLDFLGNMSYILHYPLLSNNARIVENWCNITCDFTTKLSVFQWRVRIQTSKMINSHFGNETKPAK